MKTSKRLLSIVLMLAMLVSMFTVMAFAGDKVKVTFDIGKGGTASIGNIPPIIGRKTKAIPQKPIVKPSGNAG